MPITRRSGAFTLKSAFWERAEYLGINTHSKNSIDSNRMFLTKNSV